MALLTYRDGSRVDCSSCKHYESGQCALTISYDGKPEHKESLAVAYDTEQYHASLDVEETFGCVQWEPTDD